MKKIFTLLWLILTAITLNTTAQTGTNCNAEFSVQHINSNTVKFNPVLTNDSPFVQHSWHFGDGSAVSQQISPTHTYSLPGTYAVVHTIVRVNPNNVPVCTQSFTRQVIITNSCNLVVNFSWSHTTANPLTIAFQNLSVPLSATDSITWKFGDGSTSYDVNPVHTFANAGTYTVCLRVKKNSNVGSTTACVREICKTVVVTQPCNLVVGFSWAASQDNPLRIKFTNLSTPIAVTDSIRWTFGDGATSSAINPIHTYNAPGAYTVCLKITRYNTGSTTPCVRVICKTIIVYQPCNLQVNFSSQPDPNHPLRIKFTNLSTPLNAYDSVRWSFGDGTSISGLQGDPNVGNPTHNYANPGSYTVCLRVKKNNNTTPVNCIKDKCETIIVHPPCNFNVNFRWRLDSTNPRKVIFTNLTNSPTAAAMAKWSFGDGTTATTWNAIHEYAQPGRYIVCLRIALGPNSNCVREKCDTIYIPHPVPACTELSKYTYEKFNNDNQKYKFTPDYINPNLQYTWTFGDGTGSQNPIAIHRYAQPGVYTACLTVWRGPNCASTTCKEIRVRPQINCDSAHVTYSYQRNPQVPNKIHFYANSTLPLLDQLWTITRINGTVTTPPVILHQNNPVYLFQDTGLYRVCLRAVTLGGCVKEYCNYIRIYQATNACVLQAFPNPASTRVHVNLYLPQPEMIYAFVYNNLNVLVLDKRIQGVAGNNLVSLDVHNLIAGQYNIKLVYGNRVCYARFQKL